jgi:tetratricopeptide (TPR) repeat protein
MRRLFLWGSLLFILLISSGYPVDVIQFKSGMVVEGKITKDDGVQIFVTLPAGKNLSYYKILIAKIETGDVYHNRLAAQFYEKKDYEKALKEYNKTLETQPQDETAFSRIAEIEQILKNQKADKDAQRASLDAALLFSQAMANYRDGNYELAAEQLKKALEINPKDEDARKYLEEVQTKADEQVARKIASDKERVASEKQYKEFQEKTFREKQAQEAQTAVAAQPAPLRKPGTPIGDFLIELKNINGTGESAEATLHVVAATEDRDLILKERESSRVGDYRIKVNYIEESKNEAEIEVIKVGSSQGQTMTLTVTK